MSPSNVLITNVAPALTVPDAWKCISRLTLSSTSIKDCGIPIANICLLDSESPTLLTPSDAKSFTHVLIGGILGNTDEFDFDRTKVLREMGFSTRNLGSFQMTSDTAVRVAHSILELGVPFEHLKFVDRPEIAASQHERLVLNFRFLVAPDGSPIVLDSVKRILLDSEDFDVDRLE